jgi:F-type H+-transporting ATPase subunit b
MAAVDPATQTFIVQCLGFAVLVLVIVKLALPPLSKILAGRSQAIEDNFKKLELDTAAAHARMEQYKQKVAQLDEESRQRLKAALDDATRTCDRMLADAAAQSQAAMDKAKQEIEIDRDKATFEFRDQAIRLITEAAEHVAKAALTDEIQNRLVDTYIEKIDKVERL